MPELNRIRIANVCWDKRSILDEMYDTYDGENVLLNLANGGGKSVLVQMMLQPILPNCRIQKRKAEDYLSNTSSPTYIMLEWKLDSVGKTFYLLTGIAMCASGQSTEQASRLKYFTFTNYYGEANSFDISHIPLIRHDGNAVIYMPYDEARKTIREAKGGGVRFFASDEMDSYREALQQYGIIQDEWRLMAEINGQEGGIDQIFSDCKTSDSLMDRWILKAVAKVQESDKMELQEMFFSLMSSILQKEEILQKKEMLEEFSGKAADFVEKTESLCNILDEAEKTAGRLACISGLISEKQRQAEGETAQLAEEKDSQTEKLNTIREEEVSQSFMEKQEKYRTADEQLRKAVQIFQAAKQEKEKAEYHVKCLETAYYAGQLQSAQESIRSLNSQLKNLQSGPADDDSCKVIYTLWAVYGEEISKKKQTLDNLLQTMQENGQKLKESEKNESELSRQYNSGCSERGQVKNKLDSFSAYEQEVFRRLDLSLSRNLMKELSSEEIQEAQKNFHTALEALRLEAKQLGGSLDAEGKRKEQLVEEGESLSAKKVDAALAFKDAEAELSIFEQAAARRKQIFERNKIGLDLMYQSEEPQKRLEELQTELREDLEREQRRRTAARETLRDCKSGNLHTSRRFGELLSQAGIGFDTGETYLKNMPPEDRDAYLQQNPMLPFCFLVSQKDLLNLSLPETEPLNRICPVMAYEDVTAPCSAKDNIICSPQGLKYACFYNGDSLRTKTREDYEERLRQEIDGETKNADHLQAELNCLAEDTAVLKGEFSYTENSGKKLHDAVENTKQFCEKLEKRSAELKAENAESDRQIEKITTSQRQNEKQFEAEQGRTQLFEQYLKRDGLYRQDLDRSRTLERNLCDMGARLQELRLTEDGLKAETTEEKIRSAETHRALEEIMKRRAELGSPPETERISGSLRDLEGRYRDICLKQRNDEKLLRSRLSDEAERVQSFRKEIERRGNLGPEEYEGLSYSEEGLARANQKSQETNIACTDSEARQTDARGNQKAAGILLEEAKKELSRAGLAQPLPPDKIFGNYEMRQKKIRGILQDLENKVKEYESTLKILSDKQNCIMRYIDLQDVKSVPLPPQEDWENTDLRALGKSWRNASDHGKNLYRELLTELQLLRRQYCPKDEMLRKYLENISLESGRCDYASCYYAYERMTEQTQILNDSLTVLKTNLKELNHKKEHIIRQALMQGKNLYDGLQHLSESSSVKLWADLPARQTLKIDVPGTPDGREEERMTTYVDSCIAELRQEKLDGKLTGDALRKRIADFFSNRKLLSQVIGRNHIPVYLYKVDRVPQNSRLRSWEEVLVENSGGEFFISCFILISALMGYQRDSIVGPSGVRDSTRVFLIDNPFGKTSSKHLINAMIQVAKKFHTQLICLSDLSQSSITNRFALIYQLSVRQAVYSRSSYLKTENIVINGSVRRNELLEHSVLHTQPVQMSFFQD
jgi:hypothetical protein